MAGKKSALIASIKNSSEACLAHIRAITPHLSSIPAIPRHGGHGYYQARIKYVEDNIVPHLDALETDSTKLKDSIAALETYATKTAKKFFKKDAAKKAEAFLKIARPVPESIASTFKDLMGIFKFAVGEDRKVYEQLQRLGVDFD